MIFVCNCFDFPLFCTDLPHCHHSKVIFNFQQLCTFLKRYIFQFNSCKAIVKNSSVNLPVFKHLKNKRQMKLNYSRLKSSKPNFLMEKQQTNNFGKQSLERHWPKLLDKKSIGRKIPWPENKETNRQKSCYTLHFCIMMSKASTFEFI